MEARSKAKNPDSDGAGDSLALREDDTFARKIFVAYTTHIPWMAGRNTKITREDERCYSPGAKPKK